MPKNKKNSFLKDDLAKPQMTKQTVEDPIEIKIAKISFKQGVVAALITSAIALIGVITVAIINKPSSNDNDAVVEYIEKKSEDVQQTLETSEKELERAKEEVDEKIDNTENPNEKDKFKQSKIIITEAIKSNWKAQELIAKKSSELILAKKAGKNLKAEFIKKDINTTLVSESEFIRKAEIAAREADLTILLTVRPLADSLYVFEPKIKRSTFTLKPLSDSTMSIKAPKSKSSVTMVNPLTLETFYFPLSCNNNITYFISAKGKSRSEIARAKGRVVVFVKVNEKAEIVSAESKGGDEFSNKVASALAQKMRFEFKSKQSPIPCADKIWLVFSFNQR